MRNDKDSIKFLAHLQVININAIIFVLCLWLIDYYTQR